MAAGLEQELERIVLPGTRVEHPTRGAGVVIEIDTDNERGKPYKVAFGVAEVLILSSVGPT